MGDSTWAFLLDENVGRSVRRDLADRSYSTDLVVDVLDPGAEDLLDILPYAREHDLVVVTKDYSDFGALDAHPGVILIVDHTYPSHVVVDAIERIVEAYPSREAFRSRREYLDRWIVE